MENIQKEELEEILKISLEMRRRVKRTVEETWWYGIL